MSTSKKSEIGIVGLGVMGKSLALNCVNNNIRTAVYNRHVAGVEENIAQEFAQGSNNDKLSAFDDLDEFANVLERPRKILLMVKAGKAIDGLIGKLLPLLDSEDVIIDGGNSHYEDTDRRTLDLAKSGIHFLGTGISGGEEGALKGPSIMPGGSAKGYELSKTYLNKIGAKDIMGDPCCSYIGAGGAGHFIKTVHNGIEYAEMQLLAEVYGLLKNYLLQTPEQTAEIFSAWRKKGLNSYLLEITIAILLKKEDSAYLIDKILDAASQKGTGAWSTEAALKMGVPLSSISESVMARYLSSMKEIRVKSSKLYESFPGTNHNPADSVIDELMVAYKAARLINHAIGFDLIQRTSIENNWGIDLSDVARIWTNGCIIRSELMDELVHVLKDHGDHLLLTPFCVQNLKSQNPFLKKIVAQGLSNGHHMPVLSACLNYFLGFITDQSTANLIQAQRDYFGAHTFQRKDKPGKNFLANWSIDD